MAWGLIYLLLISVCLGGASASSIDEDNDGSDTVVPGSLPPSDDELVVSPPESTICLQQRQKIDWIKSNGGPLQPFPWPRLTSKQIVFIGDEHGQTNIKVLLDLIGKLKSPSNKSCFFFEIASSTNLRRFKALVHTRSGDPETDQLRAYYSQLLKGTASLGYKQFFIDDPQNTRNALIDDNSRDRSMAENIDRHFRKGECQHAVMVVGKGHISPNAPGRMPLAKIISAKFSSTTINPLSARDRDPDPRKALWNGLCKSAQFTPRLPLIFSNSGLSQYAIDPRGYGILMRFGAFDYSVLSP